MAELSKRETRILAKLNKLHGRRKYHAWRLGDVDRQIAEATRELAAERGCIFIREDVALREAEGHTDATDLKIEKEN